MIIIAIGFYSVPEDQKTVELIIPYEIDGYEVKEIREAKASYGTGMNKVYKVQLPKGIEKIGYYAFYWHTSMTSISIPDSVTEISSNAFSSCSSLETINYGGTQEQWNAIINSNSNFCLTNATLVPNYTGE